MYPEREIYGQGVDLTRFETAALKPALPRRVAEHEFYTGVFPARSIATGFSSTVPRNRTFAHHGYRVSMATVQGDSAYGFLVFAHGWLRG